MCSQEKRICVCNTFFTVTQGRIFGQWRPPICLRKLAEWRKKNEKVILAFYREVNKNYAALRDFLGNSKSKVVIDIDSAKEIANIIEYDKAKEIIYGEYAKCKKMMKNQYKATVKKVPAKQKKSQAEDFAKNLIFYTKRIDSFKNLMKNIEKSPRLYKDKKFNFKLRVRNIYTPMVEIRRALDKICR